MRILHIVIDGDLAGGQLVARKLIDAGRERGHDAVVVSPTPGPFTEAAAADGIPVKFVDVSRLFKVAGLARLRGLIRSERIDLVHTHGMSSSSILARLAARSAGVPVVSHLHGPNTFRRQLLARAFVRGLDNLTARWCSRLIAVSLHTRGKLVEQGLPPELIEVVYNGLDPADGARGADPLRELGLRGRRVVACIGRLEPTKGQAELVRALTSVDEAVLLLVGKDVGGHRRRLERLADELGVGGRVVFAGQRADVHELLSGCELLTLPSWSEGLPFAPLEAMACRKPVVATAVGGTPEAVVDGETGILVPPRDPDRLAEAIRTLLEDPGLARTLGEAGFRRLCDCFSERQMVERIFAVYAEALATRGRQ